MAASSFKKKTRIKQRLEDDQDRISSIDGDGEECKFGFLVLGDWGMDTADTWETAASMSEQIDQMDSECRFVLATGDNFYPSGVSSTTDSLWKRAWLELYLSHTNLRIPWYAVLGNHDYEGTPTAQIEFTESDLNRSVGGLWRMPATTYSWKESFAPGGKSEDVEFFALDTNAAQAYILRAYPYLKAQLRKDIMRLDEQLAQSKAKFKIVFGHHPCYTKSNGHGIEADCLRTTKYHLYGQLEKGYDLEKVLIKRGVCAYFAGHEHVFQYHLQHGVHHFVCGASGAYHPGFFTRNDPMRQMTWFDKQFNHGFVQVLVYQHHLQVLFIAAPSNDCLYSVKIEV